MGLEIGCEFALGGLTVTYVSRDPRAARTRFASTLERVRTLGLASSGTLDEAAARVSFVGNADELTESLDLVLESVVEDLAVKVAVLGEVAERFPSAVLASNTSSLSITALGDALGAGERTIGIHYVNPPLLISVVEVVCGARTQPAVADRVEAMLAAIGKSPVRLEHDVPGFIFNRLQFALLREALWLADNRVAAPEAIDRLVRSSLAPRLCLTGPFETVSLGGVDTFNRIGAQLFPVLSAAAEPGPLERWTADADAASVSQRIARRDAGLRELVDAEPGRWAA
jgi:3-hydroxybutyryl-CoA dehydrogenase